jgi:tRNA pseudouridine55 synthase
MTSGFLLIDKPEDWTSHDVVAKLRRITKIRTIGHAGTLDPFATGLLLVAVERAATKRLNEFLKLDKTYEATMILGGSSDTQDHTGQITNNHMTEWPTEETVRETMKKFVGSIKQIPPMFSAKKIAGKKLYELARAGQVVERAPVDIVIHSLELTRYSPPEADFITHCASGTYVRTLAHDIGTKLGIGAYLKTLRRTKIGNFDVKDAITIDKLTHENWHDYLKQI